MPFVSITRLRVRSWRYFPVFIVQSFRAGRQARAAEGNIAVLLLNAGKFAFWTCTVWSDEAAMRSFMLSGMHARVMPSLLQWCDEACVAHWTQESREPPPWPEAHRRMQQEGRRAKVNHPSDAHNRFEIPAPHTGWYVRLK